MINSNDHADKKNSLRRAVLVGTMITETYPQNMTTAKTDEKVITIKEAAEKYDRAEITIRRLIRSIVKNEEHADRDHIHPSPDEVQKLKKKSKPFTYSVDKILLDKVYGEIEKVKAAKQEIATKQDAGMQTEYFDLIKTQLEVKDQQIRALTQSLDEMNVRSREMNVLMKGMQEGMFQLPSNKKVVQVEQEKKGRWWFW